MVIIIILPFVLIIILIRHREVETEENEGFDKEDEQMKFKYKKALFATFLHTFGNVRWTESIRFGITLIGVFGHDGETT